MFRRYFLDDVFEGGLIVGGQIEFPTFDTVKSTTQIPLPPTYLVHKRMANGERVAIIDSTRFVTTYVCPRRWWRCTRGAIRLIRTWATRGTQVDTYGPVCVYSTRHNLAKWQNTRWRAILVHRGGLDARGWCGYWRGFYGRTELNIWVLGCRTQRG